MPDDIRQIQIRGGAINDYTKEPKRRTTRKTRNEYQEGGDSPPGAPVTSGANYKAAATLIPKVIGGYKGQRGGAPLSDTTPPPAGPVATPAVAAAAAAGTLPLLKAALPMSSSAAPDKLGNDLRVQGGGAGVKAKLVLAPAKSKATRKALLLTPPGEKANLSGAKKALAKFPAKGTRKIRMQLAGLKKRITRSRDISKESRVKPVEVIRQELVEAKLIRQTSTVPEAVMRDIWRDYQTLRGRAL